jgi:site-specific DNA recombinase
MKFADEVLERVRDALHASHADERREHEEAIQGNHSEYKRLPHLQHTGFYLSVRYSLR